MAEISRRADAQHQLHRATRIDRIGIWEWDLVSGLVYYSPDWKSFRGCISNDELRTPEQSTQWIHPDDQAKRQQLLARLKAGELEQVEFEHRVKRNDGSWGQVVERTHAICDNDGQPIRLVGCEVDVSVEEANEQQHRFQKGSALADGELASLSVVLDATQQKKAQRNQERLIETLEATSDFIAMSTPDCKLLWRNNQLAAFRPDLNPDENPDFLVVYAESSRKIMNEVAIPAAIEHGSWSGKMAIVDLDGNEVPASHVLIAHKGSDGAVEALSTIMRDISEQEEKPLKIGTDYLVGVLTAS